MDPGWLGGQTPVVHGGRPTREFWGRFRHFFTQMRVGADSGEEEKIGWMEAEEGSFGQDCNGNGNGDHLDSDSKNQNQNSNKFQKTRIPRVPLFACAFP